MENETVALGQLARVQELCAAMRAGSTAAMESKRAAGGSEENEFPPSARAQLAAVSVGVIDLKGVNRNVWEQVGGYKEETQRANQEVDAAELKLQNLQYEKNHFLREIRHCRDFRDTERAIELVSKADFARLAPADLAQPREQDDAHQYHLNRLTLELQQRQALCEEHATRLAERTALEESISSKKAFMEGMGNQLRSLITLSLPLQRLLGNKMSLRWAEQRKLVMLPPPLRALFVSVAAYRDTASPGVSLALVGDMAKAESLLRPELRAAAATPAAKRQRTSDDSAPANPDDDVDDDEVDEVLRIHPLQVLVKIPLPPLDDASADGAGAADGAEASAAPNVEDGEADAADTVEQLQLVFCCVPAQEVVAAQLTERASSLLVNLFDDDAGTSIPITRASAAVLPEERREALLSLRPAAPYRWAQTLGATAGADGGAASLGCFGPVATALVERMRARDALDVVLAQLGRGDTTLPAHVRAPAQPPAPVQSAASGWREVSVDELPPEARAGLLDGPAWLVHAQRIFVLEVRRKGVALGVTVQVFASYPRGRPHFSLRWTTRPPRNCGMPAALRALADGTALQIAEQHAADAADNHLLHMQSELNAPREAHASESGAHCLLFLVHRLRMLLDVYVATVGTGSGATAVCGALCSRRHRGRDRRKPYVFDGESGQFDQSS